MKHRDDQLRPIEAPADSAADSQDPGCREPHPGAHGDAERARRLLGLVAEPDSVTHEDSPGPGEGRTFSVRHRSIDRTTVPASGLSDPGSSPTGPEGEGWRPGTGSE